MVGAVRAGESPRQRRTRDFTVFVLHHDGVAQGEQLEELGDVPVLAGADAGHQGVVQELELPVSKPVPAPVHRLGPEGRRKTPPLLLLCVEEQEWTEQKPCPYPSPVQRHSLGGGGVACGHDRKTSQSETDA